MSRAVRGRPRLTLLLVASVSIAAISVVDAEAGTASSPRAPTAPAAAILAGPGASSSAWYCAGGAAVPTGSQASLLVTNPGRRPVSGTVETAAVGASGSTRTPFIVAPGQQMALPVGAGASTVSLRGGGVGVTEAVNGPLGWSFGPCASSTSQSWYFAYGSTTSGDAMQVVLYNPTPTPAVADMSFVSSSGLIAPPAYQGIPVSPGTAVVETVADHVLDNSSLATEVTVLSGSVVASELQETSAAASGGMSVVEGAAAPRSQWAFAQNADVSGGGNVYTILNPGSQTAKVTVSVDLTQGQAAPLAMNVPPQSTETFTAQDETRIPPATVFGLTFSTASGSGIVVARSSSVPGTLLPTMGLTPAEPGASRWLVPPIPSGRAPGALAVVDLAGRPVHVRIAGFSLRGATRVAGSGLLPLDPDGLLVVSSSSAVPLGSSPVEVEADGPVAVELGIAPARAPGTGEVPAWPVLGPAP